jgi:hypothetical protein
MFSNVINMLNNEISQLESKLEDIEKISPVAEKVADDIKSVLIVIEPYPEEKQLFIDSILKIINVDANHLVNYRSESTPVAIQSEVKKEEQSLNIPTFWKITDHLLTDGYQHFIYFDNLKSRNGTNSLNLWKRELTGISSALSISDTKLDSGRYMMIIDNADDAMIEYMKSIDFTLTPEANSKVIESVTEVVKYENHPEHGYYQSEKVNPNETTVVVEETIEPVIETGDNEDIIPLDMGNDDESKIVDDSDNESVDSGNDNVQRVIEVEKDITNVIEESVTEHLEDVIANLDLSSYPILSRLERNQRVGTTFTDNGTELYIGFDVRKGFANSSNAELWSIFINNEYPLAAVEVIDNWESSGIAGECLVKVVNATVDQTIELTRYDFTLTPILASMRLKRSEVKLVEQVEIVEETIEPETSLQEKLESISFDPDEEFQVL